MFNERSCEAVGGRAESWDELKVKSEKVESWGGGGGVSKVCKKNTSTL